MTSTHLPAGPAPAGAAPPGPATETAAGGIKRHSLVENLIAGVTGTFLASFGLYLLHGSTAVTGGTAGLALLVGYLLPVPFAVVYLGITLPFLVLAVRMKGWAFTVRSVAAVGTVGLFSLLHPIAMPLGGLNGVYAVVVGNVLIGVGLLILFRHRASLGGFNVIALIAQERFGWRAGYVQLVLDLAVVLSALAVVPLRNVAWSALGVVVMNLVLALNHRPGRYLAG